ncbi:MAG: TrmB family transcriptional regulator [Candidatus Woesearchaeota archaeon]
MDTEILEDLGLTPSEIKTYVVLLETGTTHAGKVIEDTELQSSVTHRALLSLIRKGLVSYIQQGKHKVYSATDPDYFLKFIDVKKKRFEQLLPELKEKQLTQKEEAHTSMFKGKKGISEAYYKIISQNKGEFLTFGGSKETTDFMGLTWWKNMYTKRIDNKISQRHIASDEVLPYIDSFLKMKNTKIRFLPKEKFSQYQETAIIGDYIAITIFADEGYCILIHNKEVAEGYRKNFEMMWKLAKDKK